MYSVTSELRNANPIGQEASFSRIRRDVSAPIITMPAARSKKRGTARMND
jgi:hypothetical protein